MADPVAARPGRSMRKALRRRSRVLLPFVDPTSLGNKLILILTGVGLAGAVGVALLLGLVITPSFNRLEQKVVAAEVDRVGAVLSAFAKRAEDDARGGGDEVRPFADDVAATLDADRRIKAIHGGDPAARTDLAAAFARIDPDHLLAGRRSAHLYARVGHRVIAVGVARQSGGNDGGWRITGRTLVAERLREFLPPGTRLMPGEASATVSDRGEGTTDVPIRGPDGATIATLRFLAQHDLSQLGRRMLLLAVAGSTLLLLLLLVVLRRIIARLVLAPLARVEAHMQRVRTSGALAPLADGRRRDEIGSLGRSFNAMLRQLADLSEQIEAQSFALGRSETSVAVMHNVRNALNPVSTILSQAAAEISPVERATLDRALSELACELPAVRRAKLVAFVAAAIEADAQARDATRRDLAVAREAMSHVLDIIGEQQQRAHERPALERVDVSEVIARNAAIARYAEGASIAFSFPAQPHVAMACRVILSQVIGNLLGNAVESIAATGDDSGSITVSVSEVDGCVTIRIADDGEGFNAGIGATLFQRGFSTRAHKSGGLGLHWCANAMTAMRGTLRLDSEGPGRGAAAVLTLTAVPIVAEEAQAA